MKILACVDIHCSEKAVKQLRKKAKKADVVVCAGDVSIFGTDLTKMLKKLNGLGKLLFIIPGNHEDGEPMKKLCDHFQNILYVDGRGAAIDDVLFLGYEGECFSQTDSHFKTVEKKFMRIIKQNKGKKIVLITHAPPYKTNVDQIVDDHAGNKAIRKFIEKIKPVLAVSGHLHENFGKRDTIGKTIVINPGPSGELVEV